MKTLRLPNWEREAFEYATRLCERLPHILEECRECAHVSRYGLQKACGGFTR